MPLRLGFTSDMVPEIKQGNQKQNIVTAEEQLRKSNVAKWTIHRLTHSI